MLRRNRLAVVSHCVLNQNSVVYDLARAEGAFHAIVTVLTRRGFGIYQLGCPELLYAGMDRKPQTYSEYDTPEYLTVCQKIAGRALADLDLLRASGAQVELLVGIHHSPTCSISGTAGHLFQMLLPELQRRFPDMLVQEVPADYSEARSQAFTEALEDAVSRIGKL